MPELPTELSISLRAWPMLELPHLEAFPVAFGLPHTRPCARQIASKSMRARRGWSIIGARAAGPICATRSVPTISCAIEGRKPRRQTPAERSVHGRRDRLGSEIGDLGMGHERQQIFLLENFCADIFLDLRFQK